MSEPASSSADEPAALRPIERDVLLATSGELPWRRRLALRWRLARDPGARRLAETLCLLTLTAGDREATRPAHRVRPVRAALAIAAALLLALLGWRSLAPPGRPGDVARPHEVIRVYGPAAGPPLFRTSRALVLRSMQASVSFEPDSWNRRRPAARFDHRAPPLPLWSRLRASGLEGYGGIDRR